MNPNPDIPRRHTLRLNGYDYSQAGAYFVTICAHGRKCLFGEVEGSEMRLNAFGRIVQAAWDDLPVHYPHVTTDVFVIMPNHVHGVIVLRAENMAVGAGLKPARTEGLKPARTDGLKPARTDGLKPARTDGLKPARTNDQSARTDPINPARTKIRHGLSEVVRGFKTFSARRINELRGTSGAPVWQRSYYEHVIRNDADYNRIAEYVANNPLRWMEDTLHPQFTQA